jgi:pimeloyl-ACP methyl ester carboxylesterase
VQALGALGATLELPSVALPSGRLPPTVTEARSAGRPATIIRPSTPPPWPSLLFASGATPEGRTHPIVLRLGLALARAGYMVAIPELPGVAAGVLTPATLDAAIGSTAELADARQSLRGRVGLVGVSIGGTLALLAAAQPELAARISIVSCIAPFTDLKRVILLATTGMYRDAKGGLRPYPVPDELAAGVARSIEEIGAADARATHELLANRDPSRFDDLYDALPKSVHESVETLSPQHVIDRILAPVEIATAPRDRYFPVDEQLAIAASSRVRVTVTPTLAHAVPRLSGRNIVGAVQLELFFARTLLSAGA